MPTRRRALAAVSTLSIVLSLALGASGQASARPAHPALPTHTAHPPSCPTNSKNTDCVHAATPDITALPAPKATTTYNAKQRRLVVKFVGQIDPPYPTCPDGGVPLGDIPCSFRGLQVSGRLYLPDGHRAPGLGGEGAQDGDGSDCQQFTCRHVAITMPYDYYGPGTMIVNFAIGNLKTATDMTTSSYEVTIPLRSDPASETIHVLKPRKVMSGKLASRAIPLAGKGGVPHSGVAGVIVRISGSGSGYVQPSGDGFGNGDGVVELVKGTRLRLRKVSPGRVTVTTLGYYPKKSALTGDLLHKFLVGHKIHVAKRVSLLSHHVPKNATAVVLNISSPNGTSTFGGIKVTKTLNGEYVMVPIHHGVLKVHAARRTKMTLDGYAAPLQIYDDGIRPNLAGTESVSQLLDLQPDI